MLILDLCGGTGAWSQPYREAGYCVELIDILNGRDVRLVQRMRGVHGILAAPVCTVQSYARNRYPPTDAELLASLSVVDASLRVVFAHRQYLKWWALENPRNKLRRYLGPARLEFYQWEYGDAGHKPTCIWGEFAVTEIRELRIEVIVTGVVLTPLPIVNCIPGGFDVNVVLTVFGSTRTDFVSVRPRLSVTVSWNSR